MVGRCGEAPLVPPYAQQGNGPDATSVVILRFPCMFDCGVRNSWNGSQNRLAVLPNLQP